MAGNIADAIGGTLALADIRIVQGRLRDATRIYARGLQLAAEQGTPAMRGTADMYVGMSVLHGEQNNLSAATQHLQTSQEQGEHTGFPQHPYRWRVAMAHLREAQGDLDGALDLLDEAERWYVSDFFPNVRPVAALRARLWVAQGRLAEALGWAQEQGLSAEDELSYLHEFDHITLARVMLARATRDRDALREASGLLERLLQAAEAGGRMGSVIEILVLVALAHQAQGDIPAALMALHQSLTLAEPEGYVRMFVDEGPPMATLLERMKDEGGRTKEYSARLLAAFSAEIAHPVAPSSHLSSLIPHPLIEPLSERERDVLRLLRTDLSGPEIARELMVSLNTMRTHTKNIYDKLGVSNRRAAVRRAEALDLF